MKNSMHTKNMLAAPLAILLTSFLITARTEAQKAPEPQGQIKGAGATKVEQGVPFKFHVTGLTKDNLGDVQHSLTSLTTQVYVCDGCKHEEATTGKCTPCNLDLKPKKEAVLFEAVPSVETATIRLTPLAARTLRYSDIESALMKHSIQIDTAKFPLAGECRLVLRGCTLEDAKTIEKALMDSKLFDLVNASYDAPSGEVRVVVHANETPPMRDKVASVIDALGIKAKLTDVIWGPPTTPTKA